MARKRKGKSYSNWKKNGKTYRNQSTMTDLRLDDGANPTLCTCAVSSHKKSDIMISGGSFQNVSLHATNILVTGGTWIMHWFERSAATELVPELSAGWNKTSKMALLPPSTPEAEVVIYSSTSSECTAAPGRADLRYDTVSSGDILCGRWRLFARLVPPKLDLYSHRAC
ncbi:hypothetical protein GALMADRAFT_212132 [Galerina marginata CBS 339.88]|uniref:Uncharacterized protein n=1 Tax=Galerina marginata (strain CBS 339.88) TaxID=685588 RepID=A0A067SV26_GALM3|nr:hypothetical protein GALMADRAFT_212132 [Galerina marginata CBS 339.88]